MLSSRWRLSTESVTAIAAMLTAVIALAVGVWQTAETRRHNRLAVLPRLMITTQINQTRNADADGDSLEATIEIKNQGLGLADITDMRVEFETLDGGTEPFETWDAALPAIEAFGVTVRSRGMLAEGISIEPGQSLPLLSLEATALGELDSLLAVIDRVQIDVDYASLYDEPFTARQGARRE